jgi:hypothetical protein
MKEELHEIRSWSEVGKLFPSLDFILLPFYEIFRNQPQSFDPFSAITVRGSHSDEPDGGQ